MTPDYTPAQLEAIEYRRVDACVVAGPGAGKTTVLVERYLRLIESGLEPSQILAITFTEKAAANMKAKLAKKFEHNAERRRELESGWVSTIHGFCMRLLRENAIAAGLDPRFRILSPRESDTLQWECLQHALDEMTLNNREATLALIEALQTPALSNDLKDVYDGIRSAGMTIDDVRRKPNPMPARSSLTRENLARELRRLVQSWPKGTFNQNEEKDRLLAWQEGEPLNLNITKVPAAAKDVMKAFRADLDTMLRCEVDHRAEPFRAMIFNVLARFDDEYRDRKNELSRVDFNDVERHAIALLKNNPEVRTKVHNQFRQIMLDEFQDVNGQQAELIRLLRASDVFFAVGDVNQSIYGFRHARPEIFREDHRDVQSRNGQSVDLLHNFRSRTAILECVRAVLDGADGIDPRDLIAGSKFARKEEPSIELQEFRDDADDKDAACDREARWIAHRIGTLAGTLQIGAPGETRGAEFRDFAVLCRNGDSMPPILAALDRAGIPYVCGRRQSFLLSRMGVDITALLSVIENPRDAISLATVLRSSFVAVSDEALLRLRLLAKSLTGGLNIFAWQTQESASHGIPPADAAKLTHFTGNLARWREDQAIVPLDVLLSRALSDCGVNWAPGTTLGSEIEQFLELARTTGSQMDLHAFLHELESQAKAADMESELADEDQGNVVRVMTAHAAKGLEFPVVIVAAMDKGARAESNPVTFTPEHGIGVKWRNPEAKDAKDGTKDSWAEANSEVAKTRETHEENRLLYVAMTRAAEHLILSWSRGKSRPSNWAKRIVEHFELGQVQPSPETKSDQRDGFGISVLITATDPPEFTGAHRDRTADDVRIVSAPVIEDQHETTVPVTSLAVFGTCPRKYYIQRSLGWNTGRFRRFDPDDIVADENQSEEDDTDLPASRIGTAVHEILAGLTPQDNAPEAHRLAGVFFDSDLGRRANASPQVAREWSFIADIDDTILRGTIDLWFEEGGELHIVDYKTDDVEAAAAPARALDYAPQLALYAIALERARGVRPKTAHVHFLRPGVIVEVPLDDAAIAGARSLIAGLRKAQDELRFDLNESGHCRTCAFFRSLCPAGQHTESANVILEEV